MGDYDNKLRTETQRRKSGHTGCKTKIPSRGEMNGVGVDVREVMHSQKMSFILHAQGEDRKAARENRSLKQTLEHLRTQRQS